MKINLKSSSSSSPSKTIPKKEKLLKLKELCLEL